MELATKKQASAAILATTQNTSVKAMTESTIPSVLLRRNGTDGEFPLPHPMPLMGKETDLQEQPKSRGFTSEEISMHLLQSQLDFIKYTRYVKGKTNDDESIIAEERIAQSQRRAVMRQDVLIRKWLKLGMTAEQVVYVLDLAPAIAEKRIKHAAVSELLEQRVSPSEIERRLGITDLARFYCGNHMSPEHEKRASENYGSGLTIAASADALGLNPGTLRAYLVRKEGYAGKNKKFTQDLYYKTLKAYVGQRVLKELGTSLGRNPNTIKAHLVRRGVFVNARARYLAREKEIRLMKEHGFSNGAIAEEVGLKISAINKKLGSDFKANKPTPADKIHRMEELRKMGLHLHEIAYEVGRSRQCVSRYLKRANMKFGKGKIEGIRRELEIKPVLKTEPINLQAATTKADKAPITDQPATSHTNFFTLLGNAAKARTGSF